MADYASSLPIRTETNGDAAVKVVDGTITSQALGVDSSGRVVVKLTDGSGNNINSTSNALHVDVQNASLVVTATDLDIRDLTDASDKVAIGDGTDTLAVNADGSINAVVSASNLDIRDLTHVTDSVKVGDGTDFLAVNADGSINVNVTDASPGTSVNDYNTSAALAAAATSNHDYTVTGGMTLSLNQIEASGSGKMKIEVQVETGVATGVFNSRFVQFNSTSTPNMSVNLKDPISVAAGVRVRVIRTNRDNQSQDVYSTISGYEV